MHTPLAHRPAAAAEQCGAVEEYVQLLLEGGQKFLLFAHHTALLDAVEHRCNRMKAKWVFGKEWRTRES